LANIVCCIMEEDVLLYERLRWVRVRRLDNLLAKPDIVRIVEELDLFLLSYPGFLMVEMVRVGHIYGYRIAVSIRGYRRITAEKNTIFGGIKNNNLPVPRPP
jgi:hypothetical protein